MTDPVLTQPQIDEKLRNENLDEWLELWLASQGGEKRNRGLELMAAALPFGRDAELPVLDMCCGPGDVGRFIHNRFPKARVDCVDRDPFMLSLCGALNRRAGIAGQTFVRDMWDANWQEGLPRGYDAIASAASLHWFDVQRLGELFGDVFEMLRPGGRSCSRSQLAPNLRSSRESKSGVKKSGAGAIQTTTRKVGSASGQGRRLFSVTIIGKSSKAVLVTGTPSETMEYRCFVTWRC